MSQIAYNIFKNRLASGLFVAGTTPVKMLLLKTTAAGAFNPDLTTVTAVLAVGGVAECDFTNYARKTLASVTTAVDNTNDRANVDAANPVESSAGGATNNTPVAALLYDATTDTNDGTRIPMLYFDTNFGSTATNGADLTITIADFLRLV